MLGLESDWVLALKADVDVEIAVNVESGGCIDVDSVTDCWVPSVKGRAGDVNIDKDRDVDFDIGNVGVNAVSPAVDESVFDKVVFTVTNVSTVDTVIDEVVEKLVG